MSTIKCPLTERILHGLYAETLKKCTEKSAVWADLLFYLVNALLFWCLCWCCHCCCYCFLFWSEGAQCRDIWKNPKCISLYYCETTGYYENNVPLLLRGTFYTYSVSTMKLASLNEEMKNYEYFVIWKLSEANIISAWIIIASWTYFWKYFVIFFFFRFNGVRNLRLGGFVMHP